MDSLAEKNVGCCCCVVLLAWDYRVRCEPVFNGSDFWVNSLQTLSERLRCAAAIWPSDPASMPSLPTSRERFVVAGADDQGPQQACDNCSDGLHEEGARRARTRRFVLITA